MCEFVEFSGKQMRVIDVSKDVDYQKPTFDILPVEIILIICSYLDPYFLRNTLSKVCRRLEDILSDDHLWKHWIHSKIKGCFPPLLDPEILEKVDIDWEEVCIDIDVEKRKWSNQCKNIKHIVIKDVHFASVDTVLLVNNAELCISGARDRGMALWDMSDIASHDLISEHSLVKSKHIKHDAHSGWVWDLAPDNINSATKIYSASWDNTVKVWDLATGLTCIETFKCGMSALSVVSSDNIVMVGLFSKKILSFDLRAGNDPINSYKPHKGSVLSLHMFNNMIASVSNDKTLAIMDLVAGKFIATDIKIPTYKAYPVCINWTPTALYVGDSKGSLHLMHPEKFVHTKSHKIWPEPPIIKPCSKITTCFQSPGNLILCSDRGEIKFFYNCYPPQEYSSLNTSTSHATQMRYLNGTMVIGTCDSALEFWIPKNMDCQSY